MARSTAELRRLWAPPCAGPFARVGLYGEGVVVVRASIVDAVKALDSCLVRAGYETRRADTGAYNCRPITGGTAYSLHAYGTAIDLNWTTNPYGPVLVTDMPPAMVEAIEAIRTRSGAVVWRWGGRYSGNRDAMHYEIVASPAEIASGIDPTTVWPQPAPPQPPAPAPTPEDDVLAILTAPDRPWFLVVNGIEKRQLRHGGEVPLWRSLGAHTNLDGSPIVTAPEILDAIPHVA